MIPTLGLEDQLSDIRLLRAELWQQVGIIIPGNECPRVPAKKHSGLGQQERDT